MKEKDIIEYLAFCTPSEFSKVICNVLEVRSLKYCPTQNEEIEEKLVFCCASRYAGSYPIEKSWQFEVVAPGYPEKEWLAFETQNYWESGQCLNCNIELVSYAKSVLCPLCGTPAGLT